MAQALGVPEEEWHALDEYSMSVKTDLESFHDASSLEEQSDLLSGMFEDLCSHRTAPSFSPLLVRSLLPALTSQNLPLACEIFKVLWGASNRFLKPEVIRDNSTTAALVAAIKQEFDLYLELYKLLDCKTWIAEVLTVVPERAGDYAPMLLQEIDESDDEDFRAFLLHVVGNIGGVLPQWGPLLAKLMQDKSRKLKFSAAVESVRLQGDLAGTNALEIIKRSQSSERVLNPSDWTSRVFPKLQKSSKVKVFAEMYQFATSTTDALNLAGICFSDACGGSDKLCPVTSRTSSNHSRLYWFQVMDQSEQLIPRFEAEDSIWLRKMARCTHLRIDSLSGGPANTNLLHLFGIAMTWIEFLDSIEAGACPLI
jgi:hypothetical protein